MVLRRWLSSTARAVGETEGIRRRELLPGDDAFAPLGVSNALRGGHEEELVEWSLDLGVGWVADGFGGTRQLSGDSIVAFSCAYRGETIEALREEIANRELVGALNLTTKSA